MFATEQCLLVLTHHPAVWHQAAQFLDQSAKLLTEKGVRNVISIRFSVPDRFQVFKSIVPRATSSSIGRFCVYLQDFQNLFLKIKIQLSGWHNNKTTLGTGIGSVILFHKFYAFWAAATPGYASTRHSCLFPWEFGLKPNGSLVRSVALCGCFYWCFTIVLVDILFKFLGCLFLMVCSCIWFSYVI